MKDVALGTLLIVSMVNYGARGSSRLICAIALISMPLLVYGAGRAYLSHRNDVVDWLPRGSTVADDLKWFVDRFGSDEILVVSWPDCTLDDERLDQFADALMESRDDSSTSESAALFRHVFTGRRTLSELIAPPANLDEAVAIERMSGWLVGPDERTTCAVALVSPAGSANRHGAIDAVYRAAESSNVDPRELKIGGTTADSVAIDRASIQRMGELCVLSTLLGLCVAWTCLRDWRLVAIVFLTMCWAWSASLSALFWTGTNMDAVLLVLPVLVNMLAISGAVHLANYYRDATRHLDAESALRWAVDRGRLPCILSCITTAIGLGSLMVSQIVPIRRFGFFAAVGVMIVLLALLVLWPAAMDCWMRRERRRDDGGDLDTQRNTLGQWWLPLYGLVERRHAVTVLLTLVLLPYFLFSAAQIRTSARLEDLLPNDAPLIQGYQWLQSHLGPLVPVEVVLRFPARDPDDSSELLDRVETVELLRRRINGMPHAGGTLAASTFVSEIPEQQGVWQATRRRVSLNRIQRNLDRFVELRLLYHDPDRQEELWRVSTRIEAFKDVDYGQFLSRLKQQVDGLISERQPMHDGPVTSVVCGGAPLVYMAQQQLLRDLFNSFLTAFALIAVAMVVSTGSLSAGLLAMIPNILPTAAVFGWLGMTQDPVGIGVIMTASAALGIAVDDTLHFLVWFRRGSDGGLSRRGAVRFAYEHCSTAMLQTTLICTLAMIVFAFSAFLPTRRFAQYMSLLLFMALAGDLVVLPAMLIGPLGRVFVRRRIEDTGRPEKEPQ